MITVSRQSGRTHVHAQPRHGGVAMLLVLIAVAIATILSMSFLASQATTHGVAQNIQKHAQARAVAESALVAAIRYVQSDDSFRTDKANGQWASGASFNGGTFDLYGYDGLDTDGDGVVDDTDGDLNDDAADPVTLTVVGYFDGVSHTVHAVVTPGSGASAGELLFVVVDESSLAAEDVKRKAFFEGLGWTVTPIDDDSTQVQFDAALADSDVVYISETVNSNDVGTAFTATSIGAVVEERLLHDEFEFASSGASTHTAQTIDIIDNTHYITSPFAVGSLQVTSSGIVFIRNNSTVGAGAQVLATNGTPTLFVFDAGDELEDGSPAAGRRVALFIGDTDMDFDDLTDDGRTIVERALIWACTAVSSPGLYDYATRTQGTDIWAYSGDDASDPPTDIITPSTELSSGEYDGIESDDTGAHAISATQNGRFALMRFEIRIDEAETDVARLDAVLTGSNYNAHGPRTDGIELLIWNYASGSYEQLAVSADTEAEVTISGGVSSNPTNYIGGASGNTVMLLARSRDKRTANQDNDLYIDYVSLTVTKGVSGSGPRLLALYEFSETPPPAPSPVGHWKLDDAPAGGGGALAASGKITLKVDAFIDSYDSSAGAYGGANQGSNAVVATNTTGGGDVLLEGGSQVLGDFYVGVGGDPNSVITGGGTVSGTQAALTTAIDMPNWGAPTGMPASSGNHTVNGTKSWNSDQTFDDLTFNSSARLTVNGTIRVHVTKTVEFKEGSELTISPGSSLTLYVKEDLDILKNTRINADSERTGALTIIQYQSGKTSLVEEGAIFAGTIETESKLEIMKNAVIYGSFRSQNEVIVEEDAAVHLDLNLVSFTGLSVGMDAFDEVLANDGSSPGGVTAQAPGHGDGGTSAAFDGVNGHIEVSHDDGYLLNDGALSFWFNSDNLTGHHGLVSKDSNDFDTGGHLHVYTDGSVLKARLQSSSASYEVQSTGLSTGTWYNVVVSWGDAGLRLFLNGVERDTDGYTGGLGTSSGGIGNHEPMVFGASTWTSGDLVASPLTHSFDGRIDDVRIYDEGLNESQADDLYNGLDPGPGSARTVYDTGGHGIALNLDIEDPGNVAWVPGGGLTLNAATRLVSSFAATKLHDAITATNQVSVEVEFTPANTIQSGPARIVSYSGGSSSTNFTFGQETDTYVTRLRTDTTTSNGTPEADSGSVLAAGVQQHVIISYDGASITLYRDDGTKTTLARTGDLNWDNSYDLLMGNEIVDGYGWLGTLHRVAIYDRAFNQNQADNVFNGLPPGDGSSGVGGVDWIEP